jgi:2-polyprenyl-3-methyl-5-hydroxy-6-metoxy-1,4-benzoquinol methylase
MMNESRGVSPRELAALSLDRVGVDAQRDEHLARYYESLIDSQRALFAREHNLARWTAAYEFCLSTPRGSGPLRVLDLGCGVGTHALALASAGMSVVGVDLSAPAIESAERRSAAWRADGLLAEEPQFRLGSGVDAAGAAPGEFDIVLMHESLAHVGERAALWPAVVGALRPHGTVVIAESNALNPAVVLGNKRRRRAGQLGVEDPRYVHKTLRSERALRGELDGAGITVTGVRFFGFAPPALWGRSRAVASGLDRQLSRTPGLRRLAVSYTLTGRVR